MSSQAPSQLDLDALYAELIELHRGLEADAALRVAARLVLLLIQEVGDLERARACIRAARRDELAFSAVAQNVGTDIPAA